MRRKCDILNLLILGFMAAGFSACKGKNGPSSEKNEAGYGCSSENDPAVLYNPEDGLQILHQGDPVTDGSDARIVEKGSACCDEDRPQDVAILGAVNPIEIESISGN